MCVCTRVCMYILHLFPRSVLLGDLHQWTPVAVSIPDFWILVLNTILFEELADFFEEVADFMATRKENDESGLSFYVSESNKEQKE